jgi:hypothetical protein
METAKYLAKLEYGGKKSQPDLWVVEEDDEARELKKQSMAFFGKTRSALAEADLQNAHAILARIDEKVSKLALLYAISFNPFSPRITADAVEWAVQFAAFVVKWMLYEAQFHLAEGRFGKLMEHAKSVISKRGGSIERRDLLRALHCDEATLKRLVKALLIAEEIEAPSVVEGKVRYTLVN